MILSDRGIKKALHDGGLKIEPLDDPDKQIQPASVDLRLSSDFLFFVTKDLVIDAADPVQAYELVELSSLVLQPNEFVLGSTIETVVMPGTLAGHVEGRTSLGRLGLMVHITSGYVDPGFSGALTLGLYNVRPCPIRLHVGMRICQLVLHTLASEVIRGYGKERGSRYSGLKGPVCSKGS